MTKKQKQRQDLREKQEQLQKIVDIRRKFMRKEWDEALCDFSMARKVVISFRNDGDDFRSTAYPSINKAIDHQQEKLGRDFISYVGEDNMDELINLL